METLLGRQLVCPDRGNRPAIFVHGMHVGVQIELEAWLETGLLPKEGIEHGVGALWIAKGVLQQDLLHNAGLAAIGPVVSNA